ncbi:SRPBCC family protein [Engelhardtia mirabilis]|uniref:Activator of Hsp90 ATPase homologue 1/2-like C-terminal domain-containing protein n=1 Tax=Engelhardtia mirabilis TaxID=2528011 RepID=A0A518BQT1_9BACT|nr:hypothetical protein Pla133_44510 [Planctomycetes bacterium Pla133]QDV03658.1 hypothetical protein Pla86_44490 [Planctomycetes bacterium Pla86]
MGIERIILLAALTSCHAGGPPTAELSHAPIQSRLIEAAAGDLVLLQEVLLEAPVGEVWKAYSTEDGWRAWAAPAVEIDLRAGGTVRTHYGEGAAIGDPGTNVIHIVNYVPERLLTLRAEVEDRWPEVMKQDAGNLMNVIVFEPKGDDRTKILSYGVGYRDSQAYRDLMEFFIPANEGLFQVLKDHLEG